MLKRGAFLDPYLMNSLLAIYKFIHITYRYCTFQDFWLKKDRSKQKDRSSRAQKINKVRKEGEQKEEKLRDKRGSKEKIGKEKKSNKIKKIFKRQAWEIRKVVIKVKQKREKQGQVVKKKKVRRLIRLINKTRLKRSDRQRQRVVDPREIKIKRKNPKVFRNEKRY